MRSLALTLLLTLSKAEITITNVYSTTDRQVGKFEVVQAQSQEECNKRAAVDGLNNNYYTFNQDACACFVNFQCRLFCGTGMSLSPTSACDCIDQDTLEAILTHNLNDQCQVDAQYYDESAFNEDDDVSVYNFFGPIYGDVQAFLCDNGYDDAGCPTDSEEEAVGVPNEADDEDCLDAYHYTVEFLDDVKAGQDNSGILESLYSNILDARKESGIQLVDNLGFLNHLLTYMREAESLRPDIKVLNSPNERVKEHFLSKYGAVAITTIEQLRAALTPVFWQRVDAQLEIAAIADLPFFPPYDTCSEVTGARAYELQSEIFDILGDSLQLTNQEDFLRDVAK